jgi:hypothetical protein
MGNAAYVIEAVAADGRPVIVKVALPPGVDGFSPFEQELEALRLAGSDPPRGCSCSSSVTAGRLRRTLR